MNRLFSKDTIGNNGNNGQLAEDDIGLVGWWLVFVVVNIRRK